MVKKSDLALLGIGLVVLVSASKQIGSFFGQVGSSVGSSLSMGLQDFVSALNPLSGQGSSGSGSSPAPSGGSMMQRMMPPMMMGGGESAGQALAGGAATTAAMEAIRMGAADSILSPKTGETPITTDTLGNFFSMLTTKFPNIETEIPSIGGYLQQFLSKGGSTIEDFAANFKFPSGYTLNDILGASGGGAKLTPDAAGLTMPLYSFQNLKNPAYDKLLMAEGIDVQSLLSMPVPQMMQNLVTIMTHVTPKGENIPLSMMNLNIDGKIQPPDTVVDTGQGKISYGSAVGSSGAGAGTLLPPHTLTEVLQQHPEFTASQAADFLARTMMNIPNGFPLGTNEGSGLISVFDSTGKKVISSMVNPVELAYEAYKAEYGLM